MAATPSAPTSSAAANVRVTSAERYYARRLGRSVHADGSLAAIIASAAFVDEAVERLAVGYLRHGVIADPYPRWVLLAHAEALAWSASLMPPPGYQPRSYFAIVNKTIDAISERPDITAWLARRSPAQLLAFRGSRLRRIDAVLTGVWTRLADSLQKAELITNATDIHLAPDARSAVRTQELGFLMELRSACRALGEKIETFPLRVGRGKKVDVGLLEFYRGVLLHFVAQQLPLPRAMDMADLSMYWQLEDGDRIEIRNRWRARLTEPWADEIRRGVHQLFDEGSEVGESDDLTRERRYPSAATRFCLALL